MGVRRFAPPVWAVAWSLSLVFVVLALSLPEPPHRLLYTRLENQQGRSLRVVVYFPEPAPPGRAPAAVLCQPLNNPPEYGRMLALELVRQGFVVLTFDWRGQTPEENRQLLRTSVLEILRADVAAAVGYLRGLPGVDPERIVLAGHSVGGTLALEVALTDPKIVGVASIGMEADVTPGSPRNLLWALGLYDEFRGLGRMREVFQASAGRRAQENTTVGDFARGTARRLGVSPTADHFTELQDSGIHREVVQWFHQAVGLPPPTGRLWMETRSLLLLLAWLAGLLGAVLTLRRVSGAPARRDWALRGAAGAVLLGVVLLSRRTGAWFLFAVDAILMLLLFVLLAGFVATRAREALEQGWRFAVRLGLVLWASLFLTLVVNNLPHYFEEPRYLLSLPEFALRHLLDGVYAYLLVYTRPLLFSVYDPESVSPRLWVYAVMGLEVLWPGLLLGLVARLARWRTRPEAARRPLPLVRLVILVGLLGFLAGVAWLRLQQGFLTEESARAALRFLLRFGTLPIFFFAVLWRWTKRKTASGGSDQPRTRVL